VCLPRRVAVSGFCGQTKLLNSHCGSLSWKCWKAVGDGVVLSSKKDDDEVMRRLLQLEQLVSKQTGEIRKLQAESQKLREAAESFAQVLSLLKQAGLFTPTTQAPQPPQSPQSPQSSSQKQERQEESANETQTISNLEHLDQSDIFGQAPSTILAAADAAGTAILAAVLAGKQRLLVDVRDAELAKDPDILVQFIELAILPVAAGLEGLTTTTRNRVKIVFPTVSGLLTYRKKMALAAPEVVALSTLALDPVDSVRDNLILLLAPAPDDTQGLAAMNQLLSNDKLLKNHPVVVLNSHMIPVPSDSPASTFDIAYHLRLLSVQYMTSANQTHNSTFSTDKQQQQQQQTQAQQQNKKHDEEEEDLAAIEAAMEHAHEIGIHQGITRAMVIRAYPRPWHVFVDTSPDTDADFEVAATFDNPPSQDDVNSAIVECLEGSEREDELVAQQMQQALEAGQLNKVSEMLLGIGMSEGDIDDDNDSNRQSKGDGSNDDDDDDDDEFYNDFDFFNEDSC